MFLVEAGKDGGSQVREGDRFTIPAGFIKLSLSPALGGNLFRPGLKFLLKHLFYAGQPKNAADISQLLERYEIVADDILKNSELLKGIDIDAEAGGSKAWETLQNHADSREWHAALLGTFIKIFREAISKNDQNQAAWRCTTSPLHTPCPGPRVQSFC